MDFVAAYRVHVLEFTEDMHQAQHDQVGGNGDLIRDRGVVGIAP